MATTVPDGIWTPDDSTGYNPPVDLAAMADTIQDAITSVSVTVTSGNQQFYGPAASLGSVTGMKQGDTYQESDGGRIKWVREGSLWVKAVRSVHYTWVSNGVTDASLIGNAMLTQVAALTTDGTVAPVVSGSTVRMKPGQYAYSYGLASNRAMTGRTFLELASTAPGIHRSNISAGEDKGMMSGVLLLSAEQDVTFRFFLATGGSANTTGSLSIVKL